MCCSTLYHRSVSAGKLRLPFHAVVVLTLTLTFNPAIAGTVAAADQDDKSTAQEKPQAADQKKEQKDDQGWVSLFNGKDLEGWKITDFGGQGEAYVENGEVVIEQGAELSGIHTERKLPKVNYEIQYEAQRASGSDFFAGVTFPVKEQHCSLILGGWGGGLCGLSCLSGMDASENETTSYRNFEKGKWYKVRIVVTDDKIDAWLDDDHIVDVETKYHRISVRFEVERSKPFGFATWQTTGRIRNARIRELPASPAGTQADKSK
ncbi:MAG: DUF1080 domain-containing protein [Planctomycetaceae bacterium]|nr:DUF1080 domain-containing protein [Planctomycetaceae bacterium]MCA9066380.1 DUF1080 domain-containing protein [Planctomycetaceae bacterium]